tara:strand:+ start:857 stop:1414 length:558 start_codon:yes stop_codon:yes gene_type:complete
MLDQTKRQELEKLVEEEAWLTEKKLEQENEDLANFSLVYQALMVALGENDLSELMMAEAAAKVERVGETCPEIMAAADKRIKQLYEAKEQNEELPRWKLVFVGKEKVFNQDGGFERWSWGYEYKEMVDEFMLEQENKCHAEVASRWPEQRVEQPLTRPRNIGDDCLVGSCMLVLVAVTIGPCIGL